MPVDTNYGELAIQYFRPKHIRKDARYEWKVGTDSRVFTDSILRMNFLGQRGTIPIRLITTVEDVNNCLSIDELTDTSYQNLVLVDFEANGGERIVGRYLGTSTLDPDDEYEVELYVSTGSTPFLRFRGPRLDCSDVYNGEGMYLGDRGYDWFVSGHRWNDPRCRELTVIRKLRGENGDILDVHYWFNNDAGQRQYEVFTGRRQ
jgi:hypothetical protein